MINIHQNLKLNPYSVVRFYQIMGLYCIYCDIDGTEGGSLQLGMFTTVELAKSELLKFLARYEYQVKESSEYEFEAVVDSLYGYFYIRKECVNILHTHMFTQNKTLTDSMAPKNAEGFDLEQIPSNIVNGCKIFKLN